MPELNAPWWKTSGLLYAGGWHPLPGRIRARIPDENIEDDFAWEYSEEHILRLKELGVTILISQFDRGYSDIDQAEFQELARKQAELCHHHGLHHGTYLANTIYFESMLKEFPDCREWTVQTHEGKNVYYGGEQVWRWVACFNSPGWRQRMKRQIEKAIQHVRTDWLHFDNLVLSAEPGGCHCNHCLTAFRKFLARRYPDAASQRRRFGVAGIEHFQPPVFGTQANNPWKLDRVQSPLSQEWIDFRCWTVTDYIRELTGYARELKPDVCIDSNGQGIWGINQAFVHGVDSEAQGSLVDVICDENPDYRPEDDPRRIFPVEHKMRTMNFFRRLGKRVWSNFNDAEALAFHLTFCGDPGINRAWGYSEPGRRPMTDHQPGVKELLDHHRRHLHLYTQITSAARTAVWRGRQSLAYVVSDTHLSACVMEQLLFNNRIPFSIVGDGFISAERLQEFDLLILPNVEFVDAKQAATITKFVESGGAVLITERTGQFTGEPRRRREPAFAHLFRNGLTGQQFATAGKGRAAYIARIDYVHPPGTFAASSESEYDRIDSRYWKEPHNAREVLDAIGWLYPGFRPAEVCGSRELRLDYARYPTGHFGLMLMRCGEINSPMDLPMRIESDSTPRDAMLFRPEAVEPIPLEWVKRQNAFETLLPALHRHAVVRYRMD